MAVTSQRGRGTERRVHLKDVGADGARVGALLRDSAIRNLHLADKCISFSDLPGAPLFFFPFFKINLLLAGN